MHLLRDIEADGFPTDYLLARVRSRRAALTRHPGTPPATAGASDASVWEAMLREFEWLYVQMNPALRAQFAALFALFELKTLVLCLRNKAANRPAEVARLLAHSLLAAPLQQLLRGDGTVGADVRGIAAMLPEVAPPRSLEEAYANDGLKGFETRLMHAYLTGIAATDLPTGIRDFFVSFIDLRNVMTLYKLLRWETDDPGLFVTGGTIPVTQLARASGRHDAAELDTLVRRLAGGTAPPVAAGESALESILLRALTQRLGRERREEGAVGPILDYAWRLYVEARNQALRLHAGQAEADTLERELIA